MFSRVLGFNKLSTLKNRVTLSVVSITLFCFVLISFVSYNALYKMQKNKIDMSMQFDLQQQLSKITENFTNLLLLTQQMTPHGNIGAMIERYWAEQEPYNRSVLSRNISSSIGQILFSIPNIRLVMYYNPKDGRVIFNNLPLRDGFSVQSLSNLSTTRDISYQSPHITQCSFFRDQVISVTRDITFSNGEKWIIYVEASSDIASDIHMLSNTLNMPYILALLDTEYNVRFASNYDMFSSGTKLLIEKNSAIDKNFKWGLLKSKYGYNIALLVTKNSYNKELYSLRNYLLIILAGVLPAMLLIIGMLMKLIYRPLHAFGTEMAELGRGNMQRVHYKSGIIEFDRLFEQFNNMKLKIQQLIYDVEQKEKQKHQMEIEKLAYQINPHFLLNTLNSIHWLAVLHEQPDIAKLIGTLNYLLNYNLGKSRECATLRSELKVLDAYLKLQQIRYNFKVYTNIEQGEYLDYPAAHFLLQPIAENAIRHGLDEHGKLEISTSYETQSHMVHIAISDNGKGIDEDLLASINENLKTNNGKRNGIGLRYVKSVLESYYGNGAKMEIQSVPAQGTKVLICLPVKGD